MIDALKPLLDSGLINEETRSTIQTAWDKKIEEIQSQVRSEIREEFANRYEHDRKNMISSLDKMSEEVLTSEIAKIKESKSKLHNYNLKAIKEAKKNVKAFADVADSILKEEVIKIREERNELAKDRLKLKKQYKAKNRKVEEAVTNMLAHELAEFAQERKHNLSSIKKLEKFVIGALSEELQEFQEDKKALRETRVKAIKEAKTALVDLKKAFVTKSSKAISKVVSETLNREISQLKNDIRTAQKNNFDARIFEAFSHEFSRHFFNRDKAVKKLKNQVKEKDKQLQEAKTLARKKSNLLEETLHDVKRLETENKREKLLSELLSPLVKEKRTVMTQLLEGVVTSKLRTAFDKYLPAVLAKGGEKHTQNNEPVILHESTGNKPEVRNEPLSDLKKLAGLSN